MRRSLATPRIMVAADPCLLGGFDVAGKRRSEKAGDNQVAVGASSADSKLNGRAKLKARTIKP